MRSVYNFVYDIGYPDSSVYAVASNSSGVITSGKYTRKNGIIRLVI